MINFYKIVAICQAFEFLDAKTLHMSSFQGQLQNSYLPLDEVPGVEPTKSSLPSKKFQ